jgi:hypothetical protein
MLKVICMSLLTLIVLVGVLRGQAGGLEPRLSADLRELGSWDQARSDGAIRPLAQSGPEHLETLRRSGERLLYLVERHRQMMATPSVSAAGRQQDVTTTEAMNAVEYFARLGATLYILDGLRSPNVAVQARCAEALWSFDPGLRKPHHRGIVEQLSATLQAGLPSQRQVMGEWLASHTNAKKRLLMVLKRELGHDVPALESIDLSELPHVLEQARDHLTRSTTQER